MVFIIESPNKVKTYKEAFPKSKVFATYGHFKDLPVNELGIDIEDGFKLNFIYKKELKKNIDYMVKACTNEDVYIATDADREGYAIGFMFYDLIKNKAKNIYKIDVHYITKKGIEEAISKKEDMRKMSRNRYEAFKARRGGDRLIGYTLSPIVMNELNKRPLSVGRVQTPALYLIYKREKERENFKSKKYYNISFEFKNNNQSGKAIYIKDLKTKESKIETKEEADKILNLIHSNEFVVKDIINKKESIKPDAPIITSTLQKIMSKEFNWSPEKTMNIAQTLFEIGAITYHRTDLEMFSEEFIKNGRETLLKIYGKEYVGTKELAKPKKKSQAEAHEAIRPVDIEYLKNSKNIADKDIHDSYLIKKFNDKNIKYSNDHLELYRVITIKSLCVLMADAKIDKNQYIFLLDNHYFIFNSSNIVFDGFLKLCPKNNSNKLFDFSVSNSYEYDKKSLKSEEKETEPPQRYTDYSLIEALEKKEIGRPSTYANIIKHIKSDKYNYISVAKNKFLKPEENCNILIEYLLQNENWLLNLDFTKEMEKELDDISEGKNKYVDFMEKLYKKINNKDKIFNKKVEQKPTKILSKACSCGGDVHLYPKIYKCNSCQKILFPSFLQHTFSEDEIKKLFMDESIEIEATSKKNSKFLAKVSIDKKENRLNMEFVNKKR